MKKILLITMIALQICILAACGSKNNDTSEEEAIPVSTKAPDSISEIATTNKVEEFKETEYSFPASDLMCTMPKAFTASKDYEGEYVTKKYPKDVSSINHVIIESDENPTLQTEDEFVGSLVEEFSTTYGVNVDIDVTQFDKVEVDGRPGLWIMYNYDFKGDHYYVLEIILYNGTESNYLTFLQGPKGDWMEDFAKAAETLTYVNR